MLAPQRSRLGSPLEPQAVNSLQPREEEVFRARSVLRRRVRAREYDENRKQSASACHPPAASPPPLLPQRRERRQNGA
eukprot:scaffold84740_cov75-Phaeocystis_antarctica.AAC.4